MIIEATPTLKFLVQLEQTIMQVARQVELIKDQNEILLKSMETEKEKDKQAQKPKEIGVFKPAQFKSIESQQANIANIAAGKDTLSIVLQNINVCFSLLAKVTEMQLKKRDLEKKVKEEEEAAQNITGNRKLGNRENPIRL